MYDQLRARLASLLQQPRSLKPQTERQLDQHLSERPGSLTTFLLAAPDLLEEHELEVLFGPQFTPTLDDRAAVTDLLHHWRPSETELDRLVAELAGELAHGQVDLPDGSRAKLSLHEVLIDRFVKLLRLQHAPDAPTAAALRDALPAELWPIGIALACGRGFTPARQEWFAAFVTHAASRREMSRGLLETIAEFVASQASLEPDALMAAAADFERAVEGAAAYAAGGHAYWSADVAQHHHYRGQGKIDEKRANAKQAEVGWAQALVEDLSSFNGP
jgi:hypothetical protein